MAERSRHGLTRCPSCRAHVEAGEKPSLLVCPFCAAGTVRELGRGGALAASLIAFSAAGCGGEERPTSDPTSDPSGNEEEPRPVADQYEPTDDPGAVDVYGAPPEEDRYQQADDPPSVEAYGIAPAPPGPDPQ